MESTRSFAKWLRSFAHVTTCRLLPMPRPRLKLKIPRTESPAIRPARTPAQRLQRSRTGEFSILVLRKAQRDQHFDQLRQALLPTPSGGEARGEDRKSTRLNSSHV